MGNIEKFIKGEPSRRRRLLIRPEVLSDFYIPDHLLFREEEVKEISQHLHDFMYSGIVKNVLITGPPGVGKTAAMLLITRAYNSLAQKEDIDTRMVYTSVKNVTYHKVLYELAMAFGISVSLNMSTSDVLNSIINFLKKASTKYVIVFDEVDKIRKSSKEKGDPLDNLVYDFSRLNSRIGRLGSMLILVTNAPRILERLSAPSKSSLAPIPIYFRDYTQDELYMILEDRVKKAFVEGAVREEALALLSALIKKESKDLRWAFMVLAEAASIAEDKIGEKEILKARDIVERNLLKKMIANLDKDSLLILYALTNLVLSGRKAPTSGSLYESYVEACEKFGGYPKSMNHAIHYITPKLESIGLITSKVKSFGRKGRSLTFYVTEDPALVRDLVIDALKSSRRPYK